MATNELASKVPVAHSRASGRVASVLSLAPAPLLPGESEAAFFELAERICSGAKPADAIEEFLVRDVIDLTWEVVRLRRIKTSLVKANMDCGVRSLLETIGYPPDNNSFVRNATIEAWAAGNEDIKKQVKDIMTSAGLTQDELVSKTIDAKLDSFERLDRMLASSEARRNNALREIDRHREALGAGARRTLDEIEDVEFHDVEGGVQI